VDKLFLISKVINFLIKCSPFMSNFFEDLHVCDFKCNLGVEIDKKFVYGTFMHVWIKCACDNNKNANLRIFSFNKSYSFLCGKGHGCIYTCDKIKI
jgi:hypothetical protein